MNPYMSATTTVCCLEERNMGSLTIALFASSLDGKTRKEEDPTESVETFPFGT
jgi:hypothetical protein